MQKIKALLIVPNIENPMNPEAAEDYKNGKWQPKPKQTLKSMQNDGI